MSACLDAAGELAAVRLEEAGDVGALELLHDPGLGIAEGQREVHGGVGPRRAEEALDVDERVAVATITARSMTFSSSRTLPGHG